MTPCSEAEIRRGALLIRARPGDSADARPIEPCENVDASPDLMLVGGLDAGTAIVGAEHTVRVKVTNAGPRAIGEIDVEAWVCDRSAGTPPLGRLDPPGRMTGFFPGPLEAGASGLVSCSPKWTPSSDELEVAGRLCLAANVSAATPTDGAELTEGSVLKVCCDTHHAQRNILLRRSKTNVITTVAGTGVQGFSGDGGAAVLAQLGQPIRVSVTADGGFLIAENANHRVRKVSPAGTITTVAGTDDQAAPMEGIPATTAFIRKPSGVAATPDGGFLVSAANRILRVLADGSIKTVAGGGPVGFGGDGGPAVGAQLRVPMGVAVMPDGGFLFADMGNQRIRRVTVGGIIDTVAGGALGFSGDGVPAVGAGLAFPEGVTVMPDGGFLIADLLSRRVRRVLPDGRITTVAGTGVAGSTGDNGPAVAAQLAGPFAVAVAPTGEIVIGDTLGHRVRLVAVDGTITTIAGTGEGGPTSGDGGPASAARVSPFDVAVTPEGGILIADQSNHVIRLVDAGLAP